MTTPQERFLREEEFLRLFKKARKEIEQGNLSTAIDQLEQAYALSPDSEGVENLLGILYFRIENYRKAENVYIKLTRKNPDVFTLRANLGLIYFKQQRYYDAIRELDLAVRLKPDYARAHNYLGLINVELGKYRVAREEFSRAGSRKMAKKMESIIMGRSSADDIQKSYRERDDKPHEMDETARKLIIDPEIKKIIDDFEKERDTEPVRPVSGNVEHIRLDLGKEGLLEATSRKRPLLSVPNPKEALKKERYSMLKLGLTQKDTGYASENLLTIYFMGNAFSRIGGLIAAEGNYEFSPAKKRYRGKVDERELGDKRDPVMKIVGEGTLLLSSGDLPIRIMSLSSSDILFVRESCVFAFQSTVNWENGSLQIPPKEMLELVQFSGLGDVALITKKAPMFKEITQTTPFRVRTNSVVGWLGRLTPNAVHPSPRSGGADTDNVYIEFTGKGRLIIE